MKKLIILTGLTGTGKSSLAIEIAKKYNAEIISADSVQVYKGLDIGSAKVSRAEQKSVPHHLIDIKEFDEQFNVGEFVNLCINCIKGVVSRGKIPIIVGGTGLYIQALVNGYTLGNASNLEFRNKKEQEAKKNGNLYVWQQLNDKNPKKALSVHPNNLKRVIRYLELENSAPSLKHKTSPISEYKTLLLGVVEDRTLLYKKINDRVDNMLKQGLEKEVKSLIKKGANEKMQALTSIGYKEWFDYFNNKINYEKLVELIKQHSRNYCKRQLTFLKTIKDIKLVDIKTAQAEIVKFIEG